MDTTDGVLTTHIHVHIEALQSFKCESEDLTIYTGIRSSNLDSQFTCGHEPNSNACGHEPNSNPPRVVDL